MKKTKFLKVKVECVIEFDKELDTLPRHIDKIPFGLAIAQLLVGSGATTVSCEGRSLGLHYPKPKKKPADKKGKVAA